MGADGVMLSAATELGPFLPWAEPGGFGTNIGEALGFFALGLVGALVTIYLFLGEWLPSMGGKAEYEKLKLSTEELRERRDVLMTIRENFTSGGEPLPADQREEAKSLSDEIQNEIDTNTARADRLHKRILAQGLFLYAFLGGAFAVLFAETLVQAMLIGFGWTAVADRFGLKREEAAKADLRDHEIRKLEKAAEEGSEARKELEVIKRGLREAGAAARSSESHEPRNNDPQAGGEAKKKRDDRPGSDNRQRR
jgi:hypothetical protein